MWYKRQTHDAGINGDSGAVSLKTGAGGSTTGNSGSMELATGDSSAPAGATGDVSITTGEATGGNGGDITLTVGEGDTGNGGAMTLTAGKTTETSAVGSGAAASTGLQAHSAAVAVQACIGGRKSHRAARRSSAKTSGDGHRAASGSARARSQCHRTASATA